MRQDSRGFVCLISFFVICFFPVHPSSAEDPVIAEIGSTAITAGELDDVISLLPKKAAEEILRPENRRKFVENYITWKLLVAEARRRKVDASGEFSKRMERAKNEILLDLLQESLRAELPASDKDLKEFYESHKKDYERRQARHILVSDEKKAMGILKRIQLGGKFEDEARLYSEDKGSAGAGGDIGPQLERDLVPEISKVMFSMKAGEMTATPVKSRYGWHILRLESILQPKWAEIQEEVKQRYLREKSATAVPELTKSLKEKNSIKIYDANLSSLGPSSPAK